MIYGVKNKLLTIIFSIILGLSVLTFVISSIVVGTARNARYDTSKISCKITRKEVTSSSVNLDYTFTNDTTTDILSMRISTMVYVGKTYSGSFTSNITLGPDAKSTETYLVRISSDLAVYSDLKSHSLYQLNFKHYLTYVSFADFERKDNINELIGSTFINEVTKPLC